MKKQKRKKIKQKKRRELFFKKKGKQMEKQNMWGKLKLNSQPT